MSTTQKARVIAALEQKQKIIRENKLRGWKPYPRQLEFLNASAEYSEIVLRAGNQQGKSETAAFAVAMHATGLYPDWYKGRRWDRPIRIWECGESTTAVRDVNQRKLFGPAGNDELLGTGFVPKSAIGKIIIGHGSGGAFDKVMVKHSSGGWSEIIFKTYEMERSKWQGDSVDLLHCDEEPPVAHYMEGLARLIATQGLAISTFTPLSGLNKILPRFSERSPEAQRNRCLIAMKLDDALHLQDPAQRAALLSTFPEHERRARIEGLPALGSGAVFTVPVEAITEPLFVREGKLYHRDIGQLETATWTWAWSIDFGISHPFGAVLLTWDRDNDIVYCVAEIKMRGATPSQHAQRMKLVARNPIVLWPHDGHQREKGSGLELSKLYKNEGLNMASSHATAKTGGFLTEPAIAEMQMRFETGRLKIAACCTDLLDEYQNYHRKDGLLVKEGDDLLSALRIGVMDIRASRPTVLGAKPVARSTQRFANGPVNRDPYGF